MGTDLADILNEYGQKRQAAFFAIDYACKEWIVRPLDELHDDILFQLGTPHDTNTSKKRQKSSILEKHPISFERYKASFHSIIDEIKAGNTYVLNLTFPTRINVNMDMEAIYLASQAPFKLYVKDRFACFSPERFIEIKDDVISTYPMKGTIDASIIGAEALILDDEKEKAEHVMVVDLLRNDISMIAKNVCVEKFRYIDKIQAGNKELLQVSSKITGSLDSSWHDRLGEIITTILPAGSITGAPKRKSIEIIAQVENYDRGFFTGIFGVYDGKSLNSAVMIRFLEKDKEGYVFKSGGGITLQSDVLKEYNEMCDKVYIPVF